MPDSSPKDDSTSIPRRSRFTSQPDGPTTTYKLSAAENIRAVALRTVVEINDGFEVADMIALAEWILGTDQRSVNVPAKTEFVERPELDHAHEVQCPRCGATIRARMTDARAIPVFGESKLKSLIEYDEEDDAGKVGW